LADFHEHGNIVLTDHERQLLQEYSLKEGLPDEAGSKAGSSSTDVYEKALPRHGDRWFHKFVSVVQKNPGQVIRSVDFLHITGEARAEKLMVMDRSNDLPGLPDFSLYKIPKWEKYTKLPQITPNVHKI
jgi:hypothetical protein